MSTSTLATPALETLAQKAGLLLTPAEPGTDFTGAPTVRFTLALPAAPEKTLGLELGAGFNAGDPKFAAALETFLAETASRLRNPRPDCYVSLLGLPLQFGSFAWPFHGSTSGADTFIVHGEARLADGSDSPLHAKVSASMTRTFAEVLPALEQPFAESFIYNAVRKTFDQGQLELVKSGNRQPVPVTTRYYSSKQNRFVFNDTDEKQRHTFLAAKVFWLSHVLGKGQPVWVLDPRDAQYLNTDVAELNKIVKALAAEGLIALDESGAWATTTPKLAGQRETYETELAGALGFLKPSFNESMRAGQTNM